MASFFKKISEASPFRFPLYRVSNFPSRIFLNPADFSGDQKTVSASQEYPNFAPESWKKGVIEYISEQEFEVLFGSHQRNIDDERWKKFALAYCDKYEAARRERIRQRKIRRNKRAYNFWCGYVTGLRVALFIAKNIYGYKALREQEKNNT